MKRNGKFKDLTGKTFGLLTVDRCVSVAKGKGEYTKWSCKCACGKVKSINAQSLIKGLTKSCGCATIDLIKLSKKPKPQKLMSRKSAINTIYQQYRRNASNRNLSFTLTTEELESLVTQNCFYCGSSPARILKRARQLSDFLYNGIDRFINSVGYEPSNCVSCCFRCNFKKNSDNGDDFLKWIEQTYLNTRGKLL